MLKRQRLPKKIRKCMIVQTAKVDESYLVGLSNSLGKFGKRRRMLFAKEVLLEEMRKDRGKVCIIREDSLSYFSPSVTKPWGLHKKLEEGKKVYGETYTIREGQFIAKKIHIEEHKNFIVVRGEEKEMVVFYSGGAAFVYDGSIEKLRNELSVLKEQAPYRIQRRIDAILRKLE